VSPDFPPWYLMNVFTFLNVFLFFNVLTYVFKKFSANVYACMCSRQSWVGHSFSFWTPVSGTFSSTTTPASSSESPSSPQSKVSWAWRPFTLVAVHCVVVPRGAATHAVWRSLMLAVTCHQPFTDDHWCPLCLLDDVHDDDDDNKFLVFYSLPSHMSFFFIRLRVLI